MSKCCKLKVTIKINSIQERIKNVERKMKITNTQLEIVFKIYKFKSDEIWNKGGTATLKHSKPTVHRYNVFNFHIIILRFSL